MQTYTAVHLFAGLGGGALGFQRAALEFRGIRGHCETLVGVDVDEDACIDFRALTGARAEQMDLFSYKDYEAFHGKAPPRGWREVDDGALRAAAGGIAPDVVFTSPPCKGFSGLLPRASSESAKYQALNKLTFRGLWLALEAWRHDLPAFVVLENVPRITIRGAGLLRDLRRLLQAYGYLLHESTHNCGELGGLGQNRQRYLLVGRNPRKVPVWLYQPLRQRVRSIGEVIGPLPLPGDPAGGPLHRLPRLQWRTWVRLALIPAGGDWRALQNIDLSRYRLTAEQNGQHVNKYRVLDWGAAAPTVTGSDRLGSGAPSVADPRLGYQPHKGAFRVGEWDQPASTIVGSADVRGSNGMAAIADPRLKGPHFNHVERITPWDTPARVVAGGGRPSQGAISVADPRLNCSPRPGAYRVIRWDEPSGAVTGAGDVHAQGAACVADPRIPEDMEQGVWVIVAEDGTWHRPLTTLELAALQGFPLVMPDGRPLTLAGKSDARWRERIGNAVPPPAAMAIASQVLLALMQSAAGVWEASTTPVWVVPEVRAL